MSNLSTDGDKKTEAIPDRDFFSVNRAWLARLAAALTAAIGIVVLAGWAFGMPLLKSVLPGVVEMKANTAVGLVLAGCALFLLGNQPSPPLQRLAQGLALAVGVLGFATLGEYM